MKLLSLVYAWSIASAAIVGVDFGHKFTKAMMVAPGIRFEIIPTDGGNRKDLSAIYVDPKVSDGKLQDTERAYGSQIGSLCSRKPETCAANFKSLLGKTTDDAWIEQYLAKNPHFKIIPSSERPNGISFELGRPGSSFTFSAEELAAMSLADLKERVIKALTHHPQARAIAEDIAISIPPFANQLSRFAYKDALSLANYSSVLGLVDEGCAAALAYVSDKKFAAEEYNGKIVHQIIYDVGAGSTTATLFSFTPFENKTVLLDVESVGFDDSLGGDLLTQYVYDILYAKFLEKFNLDESFEIPYKLVVRLTEAAEKAKTILSANADSNVSLESFWNEEDFKATISRDEFEEATAHLIKRINKPILDALKNSPTGPKTIADIESVILNGGATRTPFIQKQLVDFLGDGKLSKVLNADEACAYGTTIRAYQLKMITGTGSDITLNDRILNDFEISLNGSENTQNVFTRGSSAGNTSVVNLGKITGDRVTIGLHENGKLYGSYNVTRLSSKASDLTCSAGEASLFGQFVVGEDKIFSLESLFVQCNDTKKVESEESKLNETNSTNLNSTAKKFTRTKTRVLVPAIAFTSLRPYTSAEKKEFLATLAHLKELERDKIVFEHTKNILESACYGLRFYIDDHYDVLSDNLGEKELDKIQTHAGDMVDWVDYESDSSTLKEIQEKLSSVEKIRNDLESSVRMSEADLSLPAIRELLGDGEEILQTIQEQVLEYGTQAKEVMEKYEAEGLDFEGENEKIMKKIFGSKEKQLHADSEKRFSDFKQALKELSDIESLPERKFNKVSPQKKFDATEAVNSSLREIETEFEALQKQHEQRITFLLSRMEKLKERKKQKDLKAKLREEKEKQKSKTDEQPEVTETEGANNNTESEFPDLKNQTIGSNNSTDPVGEEDVEDVSPTTSSSKGKSTQKPQEHDEL
ncbi:hypothetical protein JCM33374_g769 [Metschnikowia sp. JCM 33374]|nr:hypothetical protein JCM33374_g769 [Metschnikowia sp. JCM 33374]